MKLKDFINFTLNQQVKFYPILRDLFFQMSEIDNSKYNSNFDLEIKSTCLQTE